MDDPLPEVFSERISRTDGLAPVPVATPTCSKVLTRGDGRNAVFPFPCTPRRAPDDCSRKDALCYANNGAFVMAPKQIGFGWDAVDEYSWTIESAARLESLLKVLGENPRAVPLASSTRISGGEWLHTLRIAEGKDASVAWIQPREGKVASVDIALRRPSRVVLTDSGGVEVLGQWEVAAGERTLPIPSNRRTRLLVVDEPH